MWGRLFNLRRIVNPPAALGRAAATLPEPPSPFAACRYAGQLGNLRRVGTPPEPPVNRPAGAGKRGTLRVAHSFTNCPTMDTISRSQIPSFDGALYREKSVQTLFTAGARFAKPNRPPQKNRFVLRSCR